VMEGLLSGRNTILEGKDVAFFLADNSGEPTKFHEVYNHPEPNTILNWQVAICKGFGDMKNKEAWELIPKEKIPEGKR
jgi:hypothetical protein